MLTGRASRGGDRDAYGGGAYIGIRVTLRGRQDEKRAVFCGEAKFCGAPMMVLNALIEFRNAPSIHPYE